MCIIFTNKIQKESYLKVQSESPQFSIGCTTIISTSEETLHFDTIGTFDNNTANFSGIATAVTVWKVDKDLALKNLRVQFNYTHSAAHKFTSVLIGNGAYTWHNKIVNLVALIKLPLENTGAVALYIDRDCSRNLASLFPEISSELNIELEEVVLIVSSYSGQYSLDEEAQFPPITVLQGRNLVVKIASDKLVSKNAVISNLIGSSTSIVFVGSFSKSRWSITTDLEDLPLSNTTKLVKPSLVIQDIPNKPNFELNGDLHIGNSLYKDMNVQVKGEINAPEVSLSGNINGSWIVPGTHHLKIEHMSANVAFTLANNKGNTADFKISGTAMFNEYSGSCTIEIKSDTDLSYELQVDIVKISTAAIIQSTVGDNKAKILQSNSFKHANPGKDVMNSHIQEGSLKFTYSATEMTLITTGIVQLWGNLVSIEISAAMGNKFELSLGIMLLSTFKFSTVFPDLHNLDDYAFENILLVLSTAKQTVDFQQYKSSTDKDINVAQGLTFIADLNLKKTKNLQDLSTRMGIPELQFEAVIDYDSLLFEATIDTSWYLSGLDMYKTVFSFSATVSGIDVDLEGYLKYSSKHQSTPIDFNFSLDLVVSTNGVGIKLAASTTSAWDNAFGFKGINFDNAEIEALIGYDDIELGLGGQVDIHNTKVEVDGILGDFELMYIEIDSITFGDLLSATTNVKLNSDHEFIKGISIQELALEVSDFPSDQDFDQRTMAPGFTFKANHFDFFNYFKGTVDATITKTGMALKVDIAPLDIFDGNIKLSGVNGGGIIFDLTLVEELPIKFEFSGKIELFNVMSFGCLVKFGNGYFEFDVSIKVGDYDASMMLKSDRDFFSVRAELNQDQLISHIESQLGNFINEILLATINTTSSSETDAQRREFLSETRSINSQISEIVSNNLKTIGKDFTEIEKEIYNQQVSIAKLQEIYNYIDYEVKNYAELSGYIGLGCYGVSIDDSNCKCSSECKWGHGWNMFKHECDTTCGGQQACHRDNDAFFRCKHMESMYQSLTQERRYTASALNNAGEYLNELKKRAPIIIRVSVFHEYFTLFLLVYQHTIIVY